MLAEKGRMGDLPREIVVRISGTGIVELDANGIVTGWNTGARAIFGYAPDEIVGRPSCVLYTDAQCIDGLPRIAREQAGHVESHQDISLKRHCSGSPFMAATKTYLVHAEGEAPHSFFVTIDNMRMDDATGGGDVTTLLKTIEALEASENQFRVLVESVTDQAIFTLDRSGLVTSWNAGAENIKGYAAAEIVGRNFNVFYTKEDCAWKKPQQALSMADRHGLYLERGLRARKDGSLFKAEVRIYPIRNKDGHLTGFAKVTRDLTEEEQRSEVAARNLRKSQALAHLSHEFRTPLNAILGFSDIIQNERLGEISVRRYVSYGGDINNCGRHLLDLAVAILDETRAEDGNLVPQFRPIDLEPVVEGVVQMVMSKAVDRGVALDLSTGGDFGEFRADPRMLRQCLINLLDNAIKFSNHGGVVRLAITRSSDRLAISVADHGKGMREEDIPLALEAYRQLGNAHTNPLGGVGLGLALVKSFCDLHNATIHLQSAPGRGTEVTLSFPYPGSGPTESPVPSISCRRRHELGFIDQS